mgnify:CR=1 FL=1
MREDGARPHAPSPRAAPPLFVRARTEDNVETEVLGKDGCSEPEGEEDGELEEVEFRIRHEFPHARRRGRRLHLVLSCHRENRPRSEQAHNLRVASPLHVASVCYAQACRFTRPWRCRAVARVLTGSMSSDFIC